MTRLLAMDDVCQEHLDALCPELAAVVSDAESHGNSVAESWTGYGNAVRLKAPAPIVVAVDEGVRSRLAYRAVRDPHYWLGEISCRLHPGWFVALPYPAFGTIEEPLDLPQI